MLHQNDSIACPAKRHGEYAEATGIVMERSKVGAENEWTFN
jgi:hypothetical protein